MRVSWLLIAMVLGCGAGDRDVRRPEIGQPVPAYGAVTLDGDSVSLTHVRGSVTLLNVWATWCHPCREEIPVLQALHERYAARGFEVVGVSVDGRGEEATIREFARDFGMTYDLWHDPEERVQSTFLAVGVPATFLIDRGGVLRWRHVGPIRATDTTLVREIERALGARTDSD
jgi:thiol-disulfide isomerase/thioredoxin